MSRCRPASQPGTRGADRVHRLLSGLLVCGLLLSCSDAPGPDPAATATRPDEAADDVARFALWPAPPPAIHLVERSGTVDGRPPPASDAAARWTAEAVSEWRVEAAPGGVRVSSPEIPAGLTETIERLRLELTPGGAIRARVSPILKAERSASGQRELRSVGIGFERDAAPDQPITFEVDLHEAIRGNWDDTTGGSVVERLEVVLPGASARSVRVVSASLLGPLARYEGAAAGVQRVELDGTIRPSWFLHGGSRVRFEIEVPEIAPELRWHKGAIGSATRCRVRVLAEGEARELALDEGSDSWQHRRASLAPWAGRRVQLELSASGSGVVFFGDPRIVRAGPEARPPGILVYLIDTLRADRLGAWGREGAETSPVLDRLAAEGVVFENAISSSSWTKPAIPTLMTGIWPTTHRVGARSYSDRLPESVPLMQGRFRDAGFRTGSFSASPLGSTLSGLERGFGTAVPPRRWRDSLGALGQVSATQLHEELLAWLREEPDQPAFVYVHTLEVHEYRSEHYRRGDPDRFAGYGPAVQDADRQLGQLVEALAALPERGPWLVVVVSDHGHTMDEHGLRGHGRSLFQSEVHIPLIFWSPGLLAPARVRAPVGLPDVAPTLVELAGLPPLREADGHSLAALLQGGRPPARDFVTSALLRYVWQPDAHKQFAAVSGELRKVIRTSGGIRLRYDLTRDPNEEDNQTGAPGELTRALGAWVSQQNAAAARFERRHGRGARTALDAEQSERLRALGYLE